MHVHYCTIGGHSPVVKIHPLSSSIPLTNGFILSSLTCEADGATSYNWERQRGSIPSGAIGVNTNTLTIVNLQPEDAGNYRCVATNDNGNATSNYATIRINGNLLSCSLCSMQR